MPRRKKLEAELALRWTPERGHFTDLTVPLPGGWKVIYAIERQRGRAVFSEARVVPADDAKPPPGGISAALLHGIRVGEHRSLIGPRLDNLRARDGGAVLERHGLADLGEAPRLADGRRDELWYARLAEVYAQLVRSGVTRPVPEIASRLGLAESTVTAALRDARAKHRLLTKPPRGRAGGRLTAKARRILARHESKGGSDA